MNSANRNGILAGGLWLIDSTKLIDRYPEPGRLATVLAVSRSNGGGAFNLLVDLAKLQAEFPLSGVGSIGADANGDWILEQCRNHGVDTTAFSRCPDQLTAGTDVMTEIGSGQRTFFYLPGANESLTSNHFPLSSSSARILYLGYPGLLPGLDGKQTSSGRTGVAELLDRARQTGIVTAVDLVSAETSDWILIGTAIPFIDLLFLNEWEAARLLGQTPPADPSVSTGTLLEWGRRLIERGVRRAVVIHCSRVALCVPANAPAVKLGAVQVPAEELRGTCGAGDALAAGFLLGYHRAQSWEACLELAVCSAATCLNDPSSSAGVRPAIDCLAYGRRHGFQEFS